MNAFPEAMLKKESQHALEQSFTVFTQLAAELTQAYQELEERVALLTNKLEHVTQERLQELTEKEQLASRLEKLLTMLPTAVVVLDGQGQIQECNPAATDLLSCRLLGESWRDIIHRVFAPKDDDGCEVSLRDGKRISISIKALSEEPGQIVVMNDLTQTRALQEQIARDKSLKEMGKMVASLAHQIRTPLTTALLYASHFIDNDLTPLQSVHFAQKLKARLENIEQQVKDMLLCAQGGHLQLSPVSVSELLQRLIQQGHDQLLDSHSHLILKEETNQEILLCHFDTLVGALLNLINNAKEATDDPVHIIIYSTCFDEKTVLLMIQDDGPGIEQHILPQVTDPFFTTRRNGTGLGLDIVKAVIEEHHGRMEIDSTVGVGTQIKIYLPLICTK